MATNHTKKQNLENQEDADDANEGELEEVEDSGEAPRDVQFWVQTVNSHLENVNSKIAILYAARSNRYFSQQIPVARCQELQTTSIISYGLLHVQGGDHYAKLASQFQDAGPHEREGEAENNPEQKRV